MRFYSVGGPAAFLLGLCAACGGTDDARLQIQQGSTQLKQLSLASAGPDRLEVYRGEGAAHVVLQVFRTPDPESADDVLCLRALDVTGWPFLQAGVASACGTDFFAAPAPATEVRAFDAADLAERNASVAVLLHAMQDRQAPPKAEPLWEHAVAHLANFVAPSAKGRARPPQMASHRPRLGGNKTAERGNYASEMDRLPKFLPLLGPFDGVLAKRASPQERVEHPSMEFRQVVELYSKKVRQYVLLGGQTDIDHSATHITICARPRGSTEAWSPFAEAWTRNHGTPAADASMEHYATCDDLPITRGHFAWKGECPGLWGQDHLCNDDTRYQLWHAYGMWSDTAYCPATFQGTRPSCDKPW